MHFLVAAGRLNRVLDSLLLRNLVRLLIHSVKCPVKKLTATNSVVITSYSVVIAELQQQFELVLLEIRTRRRKIMKSSTI